MNRYQWNFQDFHIRIHNVVESNIIIASLIIPCAYDSVISLFHSRVSYISMNVRILIGFPFPDAGISGIFDNHRRWPGWEMFFQDSLCALI